MLVTSLNTTKLLGSQAIAGDFTNPDNVAAQILTNTGQIIEQTNGSLLGVVSLPLGATITSMQVYSVGTGTLWSETPAWNVSVVPTGATFPGTPNLLIALNNTITAFGQIQDLLKSDWSTYQNAVDVVQGSSAYIYTQVGPFVIPTTAQVYFQVFYYITP